MQRPHLHHWAHPCHICTETGLTPLTGPVHTSGQIGFMDLIIVLLLRRVEMEALTVKDYHGNLSAPMCAWIGLAAAKSAPGSGLAAATSASGLGSLLPTSAPVLGSPLHRHRDWAHPCHICAGTGLTPATSAPGLDSPRVLWPHRHRDW